MDSDLPEELPGVDGEASLELAQGGAEEKAAGSGGERAEEPQSLGSLSSGSRPSVAKAPPAGGLGGGYATSGTGAYADTIFWLDMTEYDDEQARSLSGQDMSARLPGGYTLTFNITNRPEGESPQAAVFAQSMPVSPSSGRPGIVGESVYLDIPGKPALVLQATATTNLLTLRDLVVRDGSDRLVSGFAIVGLDAETTHSSSGETIGWASDVPLDVLDRGLHSPADDLFGCADPLPGEGGTAVTCDGVPGENGLTVATIISAKNPTHFTQRVTLSRKGASKQGMAFGVLTSKVRLSKQVDSRANPDDSFLVRAMSDSYEISSASTGSANSASTDEVVVLSNSRVALAEIGEGATDLRRYRKTWGCAVNGDPAPELVPEDDATSLVIEPGTLAPGSFIDCTVTNTPVLPANLDVSKTSTYDQKTGVINYTINLRNSGPGNLYSENAMMALDTVKGVLDDATYQGDFALQTSNSAVAWAEVGAAPNLAFRLLLKDNGVFGPGETVTATYSVKVNNPATGDGSLLNHVTAARPDPNYPSGKTFLTGCDGKELLMSATLNSPDWDACSWTTDLVPVLSIEKSVDKTELFGLNDVATYKVKVTNHGPGVLNGFNFGGTNGVNPVMMDNLSKVIDDAQLVWTDTTGTIPGNRFYEDAGKLYWHGTLAVGETRTLSYQAKVVKDKVKDYELNNTACLADNIVLAKDADRCSSVDITRAGLAMSKTVDPASRLEVTWDQVVTYTLSFHNPGKAPAKVDTIDILDGVLDDAVVNYDWVVKDGTITVTPDITGETGKLTLTGTVPAGNTATVTYTATVKSMNEPKGDFEMVNVLLASPDVEPTCGEPGVFCVLNPLPHPVFIPHLPFTGTDGLMRLLVLGGGVVVVLLVVARRLTKRAG
ncbi:DUF7927 domain-containing protein [Leucobacter sp. USHLN153]|uniref:DUF7927 domain-containing protein n=1 Tax=Leucobacter sp. USHLN153 TaxID=3081268 RepID=UPI003FA53BA5